MTFWNILTIISALLLVLLVLVQTRGASLGAGLGGGAEMNTTRRGSEKTIFQITIVTIIVFSISLIIGIVS